MLQAIHTKFLLLTLAALVTISAVLFKIERHSAEQAAIARQQQEQQEQERKAEEESRKRVEELKKKSHAYAGNESKTWTKYY